MIPAREGFLQGYSFVRDASGTHYWAERGPSTVIRKRLPDGTLHDHARAPFADVRWMTATAAGTLFLVDGSDLKRISPGGEVARSKFPWSPTGGLMAPDGSLWILEWAQPWTVRVRRISPDGAVTTFP